jgi:hypothetical protein
MAKQTAMQKLIEILEYRYKIIEDNSIRGALEITIEDAKLLLEKEKEQIINAFDDGDFMSCGSEKDAINYYNDYYNKLEPIKELEPIGLTTIAQKYFDNVEWVFQFDDDEPQLLATPIGDTKEFTIILNNHQDANIHFFCNNKTFKIFAREKL